MKFVAFFRNLNLGRSPAPIRVQLVSAFLSAGATSAESFLTNGTLVFESNTRVNAEKVLKRARAVLEERNGFQEPAFLRELDYLAELVRRDPFSSIDRAMVFEICVTFLDKRLKLPVDPPSANGKKNVRAVEYTPSEFMSAVYKLGSSPGSPNAFIEKEFACTATTRAWNTVCRLVKKHA